MKSTEVSELKLYIDARLDSIEEMMRLSLVSNIMNKLESYSSNNYTEDLEIENVKEFIFSQNLHILKVENFGEKITIYITSKNNFSIGYMRELIRKSKTKCTKAIIVFVFDKLNGMRRKKMNEEKISYYIKDRELNIIT